MDTILEEIFKWLLTNYPTLLFILCIIFGLLYLLKQTKELFFSRDEDGDTFGVKLRYFFYFWSIKKKSKEPSNVKYTDDERKEARSKLLIHNFFQSTNNIKTKIPTMEFGDSGKTIIFRDVIRIYVEIIERKSIEIIKNHKLDELTTIELNDILNQTINEIHIEIYSKMRERLGDILYMKIIEDPDRGFKARNAIFREIFINGVTLISSQSMSVYNYDNYERASEILTSMYVSLQVIVRNFEKVFKDFNGELDEYIK